MNIITPEFYLQTIVQRFKAQYPTNYTLADGRNTDDIVRVLSEPGITKEEIGNHVGKSWMEDDCNECQEPGSTFVLFENDGKMFRICPKCLAKANSKLLKLLAK